MTKPEKELNANELLVAQKAKERRKKQLEEKIKDFVILIFVIAVFGGGGGYYLFRFMENSRDNLQYITNLNQTTLQISQLVDNIRNVYTIHPEMKENSVEKLIELGAIPSTIVRGSGKDRYLVNPFGGKIVIKPSDVLWDNARRFSSPTFKMSYQGLSRKACIDLAMLDWGDTLKGLLAVSIGGVDNMTGEDSALKNIDANPDEEKQDIFEDENRFRRRMRPRRHYQMTVAKPNDKFMPTPFSLGNAQAGCFCSRSDCSFALRYAVFSVDGKPIEKSKPARNFQK